MHYQAPKGIAAFYHDGKKYPVVGGTLTIPGDPVSGLKPCEPVQPQAKKAKQKD